MFRDELLRDTTALLYANIHNLGNEQSVLSDVSIKRQDNFTGADRHNVNKTNNLDLI